MAETHAVNGVGLGEGPNAVGAVTYDAELAGALPALARAKPRPASPGSPGREAGAEHKLKGMGTN